MAGYRFAILAHVWLAGACLPAASTAIAQPVVEQDSVTFGGSRNYPPFEWLDAAGRPVGFVIDLENAIADSGNVTARHRQIPWGQMMDALRTGEVDAAPMFVSDSRQEQLLFTEPFYYLTHGIFGREGAEIAAVPEDLTGHTVAVVEQGYAASQLRTLSPEIDLVLAIDIRAALRQLASGEVDFAVVASHVARRFISDGNLAIDQVSRPFWPRSYAFAVRRDNTQLHQWLQHHLGLIQANGAFYALYNDWAPELEWHEPVFMDFVKRYAGWMGLIFLASLLIISWSWLLRRQVKRQTAHLRQELERRQSAEAEIEFQASHDLLTGLPNRARFIRELELMNNCPGAERLTVVAISLNGMEEVVVTLGYDIGEAVLESFTQRLRSLALAALTHLGSGIYAGAKWGPLSPREVFDRLTRPLQLTDLEIDPRISVGIATGDLPTESAPELLRKARTALSAAVENRRPWQSYSRDIEPDQNTIVLLRDFWRMGTDGFIAFFQPQVDLQTGSVMGAEALVRWNHPDMGLLPPAAFVPVLEKAGVINRLTERMINEAVRFSADSRRAGTPCPVSVNITATDLLEHDLIQVVSRALETHEGDASDLHLEMTETGLVTEPLRVGQMLTQLRLAGVHCAIDDFGTGYSSLAHLSNFPVRTIKIDRCFVGTMVSQKRQRAIVESTINLAHELDLSVIAEGPEDRATIELLKASGCDVAQGYYYSKPLSEEDFLAYLRQSSDQTSQPRDV